MSYDAADNAAKSYDLAVKTMRDKLENQQPIYCAGVPVRFFNEPRRAVIYAFRARGDAAFAYIGSTVGVLKHRVRAHILTAKDGGKLPIHDWIRSQAGGFDVVVLEDVSAHARHERERHWVALHRATVLNVTDGGPGMSGHKFAGSEHAKRIGVAGRSGAHFLCNRCGSSFWRARREINLGHNKFCSRVCSNARHKECSHA